MRLVLAALACAVLSACALLGVREQREAVAQIARIRGTVRVEPPEDSVLVVVLVRLSNDPKQVDAAGQPMAELADHYVLQRPGTFAFAVAPGTYRLAAFADRQANLVYDPGEPALAGQAPFALAAGATRDGVELVIPRDSTLSESFDIRALQARTPNDQENFSIGRFTVRGQVADLRDPKFGEASGQMGMWRFVDFIYEIGPGVYFLEAYDPKKIPVLFVHGISGYPQQFAHLIEQLDREHFQPWFYFYPSGFHLDGIASHASEVIGALQSRLGFDAFAVVAHSMGGLVARAFIQKHFEQTGRDDTRLFVAISSPWGGSESAANVANAPAGFIVYSWLDMNPASDFLKALFYQPPDFTQARPLPEHTDFHMIFGYKRKEDSFGPSADGVLTVRSETRIEAILAARSVLPLDYDHVGILASEEAARRLNAVLAERFDVGAAQD